MYIIWWIESIESEYGNTDGKVYYGYATAEKAAAQISAETGCLVHICQPKAVAELRTNITIISNREKT